MNGCITVKKITNVLTKYDYDSDANYIDIECIAMDEMGDTKDMNIIIPYDTKGIELIEEILTGKMGKQWINITRVQKLQGNYQIL